MSKNDEKKPQTNIEFCVERLEKRLKLTNYCWDAVYRARYPDITKNYLNIETNNANTIEENKENNNNNFDIQNIADNSSPLFISKNKNAKTFLISDDENSSELIEDKNKDNGKKENVIYENFENCENTNLLKNTLLSDKISIYPKNDEHLSTILEKNYYLMVNICAELDNCDLPINIKSFLQEHQKFNNILKNYQLNFQV